MRDVYIAGTGMTAFGKFMDSSVRKLAEEATADALRDAHASPGDIEIAFFSNATAMWASQKALLAEAQAFSTLTMGTPSTPV